MVSRFWESAATVVRMVAPPVTNPPSNVRVVDDEVAGRPRPEDLARLSAPLPHELTAELDGTVEYVDLCAEELLLAALGRAIARTIGVGVVTVSGLTTVAPIRLCCATERHLNADGLLAEVRHALTVAQHAALPPAEVVFSYLGMPPDPALGPLQVTDGPALGLLAYRRDDETQMDWWYDMRRLDRCTVEELAAQFRLGLIGLTSEAGTVEGAA